MSSPSSDWAQFYQHNHSGRSPSKPVALFSSNQPSDATTVTAAATTSMDSHLSPEGRVAKPIRRRSRASRRTPTTLLNTDTTNFRAMVQQFTGGPSAPFASGSGTGPYPCGTNLNFGLGTHQEIVNPRAIMAPRGGYNIVQLQQQQHQQQYMLSLNNTSHGDFGFLQRFHDSRPDAEVSGGFAVESGGSTASAPLRASSINKNSSAENYMF